MIIHKNGRNASLVKCHTMQWEASVPMLDDVEYHILDDMDIFFKCVKLEIPKCRNLVIAMTKHLMYVEMTTY